jgi:protein TonB
MLKRSSHNEPGPFVGALAISALAHACALAWIAQPLEVTNAPAPALIPISLALGPGRGGRDGTAAAPTDGAGRPDRPAPIAAVTSPPKAPRTRSAIAKRRPAPPPAPPETAVHATAAAAPDTAVASVTPIGPAHAGPGTRSGGSRPGNGSGPGGGVGLGQGGGGTGAGYASNPLPPYPLVARRLGIEGVVFLDVMVASNGRAARVLVARSSGHEALDESAFHTVRDRWRFVPAQRDGRPVETRVTVPIRFRLTDHPGG